MDEFDLEVHPSVYPPSEDSFLLYDSVVIEDSDVVLDMGCGTGILALKAAKRGKRVIAVDVSGDAVANTQHNLARNDLSHKCTVLQSDLTSSLDEYAKFSVVTCNPPYVPAGEDRTKLDHALVGGEVGTEFTIRLVGAVRQHLFEAGSIYVVVTSLGDPNQITEVMENTGLVVDVIARRKMFFEELSVLRGKVVEGWRETVL
ncbi:MAG: HemK2/MTQ2 family protein methyltransferase [Candidatus Thorarchaeota archaeon]|jgi:release factor glutamine methyltransferase